MSISYLTCSITESKRPLFRGNENYPALLGPQPNFREKASTWIDPVIAHCITNIKWPKSEQKHWCYIESFINQMTWSFRKWFGNNAAESISSYQKQMIPSPMWCQWSVGNIEKKLESSTNIASEKITTVVVKEPLLAQKQIPVTVIML